jgi:hypothetical protein
LRHFQSRVIIKVSGCHSNYGQQALRVYHLNGGDEQVQHDDQSGERAGRLARLLALDDDTNGMSDN